jgi:hypothetical protein
MAMGEGDGVGVGTGSAEPIQLPHPVSKQTASVANAIVRNMSVPVL